MPSCQPNFFIVGAPKCGTTALYHALLAHPEVFLPHSDRPQDYWLQKEPMFFSDDLGIEDWIRVSREEDYRALFAEARDERRVGEVSALYLLSPNAPRRIQEFSGDDPDLRIIILLRPPVDWMRSWHHDCLRYAHETIADFREALAAEPLRQFGQKLPRHCGFKGCLNYRQAAHFSVAVERYFRVFGRERVRVFLMEDLNADPGRVLGEIAAFLDISPGAVSSIERQNDSAKLTRTHLWEFRLKRKLQSLSLTERWAGRLIQSPGRWYRSAMLKLLPPLSDKDIDPALREALVEEFRPEVERLGALIGRDLSHWNEPSLSRTAAPHHLPNAPASPATAQAPALAVSSNGAN